MQRPQYGKGWPVVQRLGAGTDALNPMLPALFAHAAHVPTQAPPTPKHAPTRAQAYRLLAEEQYKRSWDYPLHLGVTGGRGGAIGGWGGVAGAGEAWGRMRAGEGGQAGAGWRR